MNKFESIIKYIADTKNFISVHTVTLCITLWMTFEAYAWAGKFAYYSSDKSINSLEIAAIIAAVTAPITYLQKAVFEIYSTHRKNIE